tara:strand:- start:16 stop:486 length:471 start_codon:yes stop_codon:yes gene_type:complete
MKTLLSIIFILTSSFTYSAGTDSGSSSSSSASTNNVDVNIEFNRAKKLIYKKDYAKGLKILKDIENERPFGYSKADLYNYMGFASRKQKDPDFINAENYYLKALSLEADHIGALEYLGELYYETDRASEAKSLLEKLGEVAGKDSTEYKELSELLD